MAFTQRGGRRRGAPPRNGRVKMGSLVRSANIARPDFVYQRLIDMHGGRSDAESLQLNAKLILILLNHIGDEQAILEAIELASPSPNPTDRPHP